MQYEVSFINPVYPTNKIFTNTVGLKKGRIPITVLQKVINSSKDSFGSTKKTIHYVIPHGAFPEIETLSRNLVTSLTADLPHKGFEFHVLTKRVEYWKPKDSTEDDFFNAIRFTAVVNHTTNKVWITPILTVVPEESPKIIPEESSSELEEEDFLLQPQPLQRSSRRQLNTD